MTRPPYVPMDSTNGLHHRALADVSLVKLFDHPMVSAAKSLLLQDVQD